ncbi:MAG TPA: hypothetical protein DF637_08515 [Rikenellaceae bacterium]|nr:hypothetical protein [Rikenellaceae bacterium]
MGIKAIRLYFRFIVKAFSFLIVLLSVTAIWAHKIDPATNIGVHYIIFFLPLMGVINGSLFIWWLARKKVIAILPLIGLFLNLSFIPLSAKSTQRVNYFKDSHFAVMSYNVHYFSQGGTSNLPLIASLITSYNADVVTLQEVQPHPLFSLDEIKREFNKYPYSHIHVGDHLEIGMALFSKYPIISAEKIKFEDSGNGVILADILFRGDTIRIINVHLQTTGLSGIKRINAKNIINSLGGNLIKRSGQAKYLRELIDKTKYPLIICGDFNDVPQSFTYHTIIGADLTDSFKKAGSGIGGTFSKTMGLLRIDYIFHSKHFKSMEFKLDKSKFSDHRAIFSLLEYQN